MAKLSLRKVGFRQKSGFSLVVVLIMSLVGLALVGVVLQLTVSSGGSGRVSSAMGDKYNRLQDALEEGRAMLTQSMDSDNPPPRYFHKKDINENTPNHITSSNILLLADKQEDLKDGVVYPGVGFPLGHAKRRELNKNELARVGIFGESGLLTVRIYDMQYDPKLVAPEGTGAGEISPEELRLLPPSMLLWGKDDFDVAITTDAPDYERDIGFGPSANNAGVYLIRAELSVTGADGSPIHTWSVETAVVQATNQVH